MLHHLGRSADHEAVAALRAPDAAAGAHVAVLDALFSQLFGAANVVNVIRVSAVDQDVALAQQLLEGLNLLVHHARRNHQPHRLRRLELVHKVLERGALGRAKLGFDVGHRFRAHIEHHAAVTRLLEALDHIASHSSQSNQSNLHGSPFRPLRVASLNSCGARFYVRRRV